MTRLGQILFAVALALCAHGVFAQTFTSNPNVTIPDGSRTGVTSTIAIPATSDRMRSIRLDLRINHNEVGNLDIYLIPPWASWAGPYTLVQNEFSTTSEALNAPFPRGVIELSTDNGGNGNNYGSGNGPYTYARFSAAGDPVDPATQAITAGAAAYTADVYIPEGVDAFEDLYGRNPSGTWTLVVADDDTAGNAGTLVSWRITYAAVAASTVYAHLGAANDPGLPIVRGAASQVLGQFRLDATAAANVTSIVFRESAATNLDGLLTAASLYRDNNGDGLLDGGDTLLNTAVPAASPNITFNFAQAIGAGAGVDLLLVGTVAAAPAPVSMQMEIQTAASISSDITEAGLFARRAGPRPFVSATTFTYRPLQPDLIVDNNATGITRGITVPATSDRINSLRVGVRLNHTYTADLDIYLLPPGVNWSPPYAIPDNGPVTSAPPQAIELSTDNGTNGNNYGADLTSSTYNYARFSGATDPTWATATNIVGATAPFTAAAHYRPEGLSAWNLNYSGDPSGNWRLIVVDSWGIDVGYLISWQLEYVAISTPQFWVVAGEDNTPGTPAYIGTTGNVLGQIKLESFGTNSSVSQIVVREQNGLSLTGNLSALSLYQDNNSDGLFDVGDTLLDVATLTATTATFDLAPLSVPTGTSVRLLLVGTLLATPANSTLALQLSAAADVSSVPAEIAPYAVQFGAHPFFTPNTYVATPPGGLTIPANSGTGVTSTITIPATQDLIGALRVGIRIDHAADADLDIWLIPPGVTWAGPYTVPNNGTNPVPPAGVIELSTDNGGNGNNYGSGTTSFVYTVFSRDGDRQFNTGASTIGGGTAAFTAASGYQPEDTTDFNALYGTNPSGDWTLAVADDRGNFSGKLLSWFVQYVPAERAQVFSTPTTGFSDFGNLLVGTPSAAQGFIVQNMGNFSLTLPAPSAIAGIRITGTNAADFVIQGVAPSGALAAGASTATFNIVFTPSALGLRTAFITVTWNNSDATMPPTSTSNYAIQGTGALPLIEVREADVSIGAVVTNGQAAANGRAFGNQDIAAGPSTALTIFVKNTGVVPMTLGLPVLGGANPGDFVLNTAGYLVSVPAGSSTSFTVAFDPTVIGARAATVSFTHNASNTTSPFSFDLSGTGVQPTVTVASAGSPSEAGPTAGTFTITGAPAPSVARTVNFTMSGLANFAVGVDYNLSGTASYNGGTGQGTVTLGISGTAVITLTPVNESVVEALESATLTLNAGTDYAIGAPSAATLNIADNDVATIAISNSGSPSEAPANGTYTISTLDTLEVALTINFTMSGVAVSVDYALAGTASFAFPNGSVTLGPGVAPSANVTLTPVNDAFVEGPETATMTVTAGTQYTGTPNTTLTIADNDTATITVSSAGAPNETGPVNGTYTITVTPQPQNAMSVNLSLSGAAQFGAGSDYTIAGAAVTSPAGGAGPWLGTVNIPGGGGASVGVIITLNTQDDARVEATELATLDATADTLLSDPAYSVGAPASANLSILDNDTASVSVTSTGTAAEPGTAATYTIATTSELETPVTVSFTMSGSAQATVGGDYNLASAGGSFTGPGGTAVLPVGSATNIVVTLMPVNDAIVEATETATLTVLTAGQVTAAAPTNATLNITDDDTVTVTVTSTGTAAEPATAATFTIQGTGTLETPVTVSFTMSGSAGNGVDYTLAGTGTLPVGTNTQAIITLNPIDELRVEATETAQLTLNAGAQVTVGAPASATLNITDNDTATVNVSFAGSPGEAGPTAGTFTLSTVATLDIPLTVNFSMSGSADVTPGTDYNLSSAGGSYTGPGGTAVLPVGVGSSVIITLTPFDDAIVEGTETATVTISGGGQVVVGTAFQTHNIADNDTPTVTVTASGSPAEGGGGATFTIATTATLALPLTVNFTLSGLASTVNGTDYTLAGFATYGNPSGTATLPAGVAPSVNITLAIIDDAFVEGPEDVLLTLNAGIYNIGGAGFDSRTIADNDTATISVTLGGSPSETPANGTYTITATPAPVRDMLVDFAMSGTASFAVGGDYTLAGTTSFSQLNGLGTVTIGVGGSVVVTLSPVNDAIVEAGETATLTVTADSVFTDPDYSGTPAQTHTIADNDSVSVSVTSSGSPSESGATGTYTIQSASTIETPVTVTFTMSGVAGNGVDYNLAGTGTLPVGTNTQAIITLTPVNDARVEATEDATLTLNAGAQVTVGAPSNATLNILDNDLATVTVSTSGTPTEAGSGSAIYTLSTTDILDVPVTVSFLMSGAASTTPGTDYNLSGSYTGPGGSAVLPVGTGTSVNVTLTPIDDARVEANEAATLTVQTAGQAQAGAPAAGTLNITDNDIAVITVTPAGSPSESGATGTYTVATGATLEIALTVNFTMSGAAVNADYALSGTASFAFPNGSVTLPMGTGSSAPVTLTPANDALVEGPEDATLTVTAGTQYSGTPFGTLTIADNDTVVITLSTLGSPSEAGPTAATFRVTATPQPSIAMSVNLSLSGSATFGGAFDYSVSGATITTGAGGSGPWVGTVSIPGGGGASTFVDITITPNDDARVEATESVQLDITADTLLTDPDYSGTPSDTLNITDNDTASVSVTSSGAASEPGTGATYIIQSASTLDVPVTVTFTMSGTAQTSAGGDYNLASAGGTFTGPGGTAILPVGTNTQIVVTLSPVNDAIVEATESADLTLLTAGQVTAVAPVSASLNIADDDTATVNVSFAGSPSEAGPTSGTFTLSTAATLEVALTVNFTMSGAASTVPGTDYNITSAGGTYTGPGGSAILPIGAAPSVVITLAPIDDVAVEGGETATLTISGGGQVVVGTSNQTHTIADNDTPTVTVTASGSPAEAGGGGTFTIATSATLAVPLTVYFTMSGLAFSTPGTDYTLSGFATYASPSGTVTLPAGAAPSVNVTFAVTNDTFVEGPESVIMTLNAGLYTVGGAGFDALSIADNDTAVVTMTSSGSPNETGPVNGTYTIRVTPQPRHVMSVNFALSGTAQFGAAFDYTISGASISTAPGGSGPWLGTVNVPAGGGLWVDVFVTLQTQDDAASEATESATLTVTADSVATDPAYSGAPSQSLNILDNDQAVITVVGGPLSFGGVEIGTASAPQSYSVSAVNLTANLVITPPAQYEVALAAGGPWLSVINLVPSSGTVASTSIFVRFAPTSLGAAGGNVSNASAGAATQDVAVSGIGTGITASAASVAFGNQLVGTASAAQTYTVQAEGLSANLLIGAPAGFELSTTGGAPWFASLNLGSGTIAPTVISVRFAPAATGAASGNVSNASAGFATRNVSVSGNGIAGLLNISGTQNHGSVPITLSGAAILYTISNVSAGPTAAPLTVNSVTLGGANAGDFALSAFSLALPTVLAPGNSLTFLGTFTPSAQGVRNADVVVNSNTGGEPPSNTLYAITGTGTAGLFAATPTFPAQIDNGGPVVVNCVISALANTTADVLVEYIGGSVAVWTPAVLARTNVGTISGSVVSGMPVLATGSTLEILWDAYATERHVTAANYQIRFTPSNGIYGTGTTGTSIAFTLARDGGWAKHSIPVDYLTGRFGQSTVFDAANDRLVVFAGAAEFMQLNDVWAYDRSGYAQGWHRINAAGTPPAARQYPVAVYDAANQRMIMFGGWNSSLGVFNDTWALSLTRGSETWTQLAPSGTPPAARHFHAADLDLARNRMLMFGGKGASGNLGDIWELTLSLGAETWTQLAPTGTGPTARNGAQMVVDVPRDRLVIYGGDVGVNSSSTEVFALSLATPPGTWSTLTPATPQGAPVGRHMAAYGYCANRQSLFVEAGYRTGGAFNSDSWLLDLNGSPTWTPVSADPVALQGRCHGTTGYDAARGQLLVFGGINKYAKLQDSLSFLDTNAAPAWQLPPSQSALADTPGQRNTQSMVFDTRYMPNGRVIVFGGNNLSNTYNDVWYLDPSLASPTWTKLNPAGTPPSPRGMCAVAYDGAAGSERMIVFGGVTHAGVALNEVWILDLSNPGAESWSQVVAAGGPTPRTRATAVVDQNGGSPRLLVFGGDGSGRRNDVWSLNLTGAPVWTLLAVPSGSVPAPRFGHGMTHDTAGNRLIIYYGNCAGGFLQDTWAFNLTTQTWTDITQTVGVKPSGRENFPTASALAGTRAYLHAGLAGSNQSDLWRLDVPPSGAVTWTQVNFTGAAPLPRHHHSVCIDSTGRLISGFGYVAIAANKAAADIWAIDPLAGSPAWQQLQTSSQPRGSQHAASALDAANGRMIVFGGLLGGVLDGRLWQLSLNSPIAAWTELSASGVKPAPRRGAKFVYDPVGSRMLMYGGYVGSFYQSISNEMWQLSLTPGFEAWTLLSLGGGPAGLADYSVVYDPVSHSAVYFGGQLNTGGGTNNVWRLALGSMTWTASTATTKPVVRYGHSAIYDAVSARIVMFGGKYGGTDGVNDLWSYNIATDTWTQLAVAGAPGGRYFHSAVFDSTLGQERMIVFCGFSNGARSDAWMLDLRSGFPLSWSPLTSTVALPQPRWAHNAVFDTANLRMVLAGGYTNGEEALQEEGKRADTWFYGR